MTSKAVAAIVLAVILSSCASPPLPVERVARISERIVLLPSDTDRPSSIIIRTEKGEIHVDTAYQQVELRGAELSSINTSADEVKDRYGDLLAAQPKRARSYTVYFMLGTDELTAQSKVAFEDARKQIASWPAVEVVVIGHTDRLGSEEHNNKLSLQRAQMIAKRLIASGVRADDVTVAGRGELEPIFPTADNVPEPRNRRVEIKVR